MRRAADLLLASVLAVGLTAPARAAAPDAEPIRLLDAANAGPSRPYQGRVLLTQWTEKKNSTEEVNVYFSPPGRYRLEFLSPDGSVDRVVIGDGQREQVQLMKQGKVFAGYNNEVSPRLINREEERRLLLANYKVSGGGQEDIMGRRALVVDLTPIADGKPTQRMWIDKETGAVLEVRRTLPGLKTGATSRFTRFEVVKSLPESLFGYDGTVGGLEKETDKGATVNRASAPKPGDREQLSGGFALLGSDLFDVKGEPVRHLRYTDGLIPVSLFVTHVPVDSKGMATAPGATPLGLVTAPVQVNHWKQGSDHYTLMGEVSPGLLREMSSQPSN